MLSQVERQPKAMRVIAGTMLMAAFVLIAFALISRYAGAWGVPYFGFTTDRGSTCTNNLTGYTCSPVNLRDVEFFGDVDLPNDTAVKQSTYVSTHDFALDARMEVPKKSAAAALKALNAAYGPCQPDHPSPLETKGIANLCVMANDDAITGSGETTSRVYVVGTGLRKDGVRVVTLSVKSR